MRILQIHNRYQQPGGEERVVDNERHLLLRLGHEVELLEASNDEIGGFASKIHAGLQTTYSHHGFRLVASALKRWRPDVVHVHNFFPLLSPAVYDACQVVGIPVVQTLHNFRTICAGGILLRNGRICESCIEGSPYQAVIHRCYRGSTLGSLAVANMISEHRRRGTWQEKITRFIALTNFNRSVFIRAGFPPEKIRVKPNFCPVPGPWIEEQRSGALYVGRLSEEKGIRTLLAAFQLRPFALSMVGDGPLRAEGESLGNRGLRLTGTLNSEQVGVEMTHAAFLIIPSEWYEGFPMVLIEAFSRGLPVLAARLGNLAEIVEEGRTGWFFEPGNPSDLARQIRWAEEHPDEVADMGRNALARYQERYAPDTNGQLLLEIYREACLAKNEVGSQ